MRTGLAQRVVSVMSVGSLAATASACTSSHTGNEFYNFRNATSAQRLFPVKDRQLAAPYVGRELDSDRRLALRSLRGHVVVINFWASWCGPCKVETPQFELVYRSVKAQGVKFVGVDYKDDEGAAQNFLANNAITFPVVADETGKAAITLGNVPAQGPPFTILLDKHGRVAAVYLQRLSPADLRPSLRKLDEET